jgi:alkanesulfonate monooxygenase SsuD/methylene tetrahydromethanopterin reductase-like flavin-dependent oxidoreductase (luciferase family)
VDEGVPVRFGWFPEPLAERLDDIVRRVELAERLGLDLVGIQDHPYQRRFLDTFTLLAVLATRTSRIGLFTDVASLPLRPPGVLAKTSATLDLVSGGRFDLGLGAGAFWDAIEGLGGPRRTPGEALAALEEAIAVLRLLWSGERGLRFDGRHYRLGGVHGGPVPSRPIGIWVGAGGPRMMRLIGRAADGWVPSSGWLPPSEIDGRWRLIEEAALEAGRDPGAIRRLYNVAGRITGAGEAGPTGFLDGPPKLWTEQLTELVLAHGVDSFILWPKQDPEDQLHRLAEEVAPAVREAVAAARLERSAGGPR